MGNHPSFDPPPAWIGLTVSIFRMLKFERYIHGFSILGKVFVKSEGVLAVGGMAAACVLIFASTLMYYAERNNPDPKMAAYYASVPGSMWITLLNLSGEVPLSDYQTSGAIIVGALSVSACAIFAIPSAPSALASRKSSQSVTVATMAKMTLRNAAYPGP